MFNEVRKTGKDDDDDDDEEEVDTRKSKGRPVALVISGGYPIEGGKTNKSMKRRWTEILSVASTSVTRITSKRPPLAFGDDDFLDGKPNKYVPLLITAVMANVEVRRVLIDQGSSADIIFEDILDVLKISRDDLTPYRGSDLTNFNGSATTPLGHLELMVTFGDDNTEKPLCRMVKTPFLVLPWKSLYQCIIGRPTLGRLGVVASTVHLKMKFYSDTDEVITLLADLHSAVIL